VPESRDNAYHPTYRHRDDPYPKFGTATGDQTIYIAPHLGRREGYFAWISAATVLRLSCVLGISPVSRLFAFEQPTPWMLLSAVGLALLGLMWFEGGEVGARAQVTVSVACCLLIRTKTSA